jgi:hypothetical protein
MSDFTAIRAVTKTLESSLTRNITNSPDPQLNGVPIDLRSPKEMRLAGASGISLWLYRVTRDPDLLNRPGARPAFGQILHQPLPIHLFYLVTPLTARPEDRQVLLGKVLQVFNDQAILRGSDLQDTLKGSAEELRMTLETLTLEELTRIWYSLQEPYDLSVTYAVQVISIESDLEPIEAAPVLSKRTTYSQILSD